MGSTKANIPKLCGGCTEWGGILCRCGKNAGGGRTPEIVLRMRLDTRRSCGGTGEEKTSAIRLCFF